MNTHCAVQAAEVMGITIAFVGLLMGLFFSLCKLAQKGYEKTSVALGVAFLLVLMFFVAYADCAQKLHS